MEAKIDVDRKDRISKLPEPILHHILCFLDQKMAAQTCVLSESWRHLWCTRPKFEFREELDSTPRKREAFLTVVDRTLQGYYDRKLRLQELRLSLYGEAALLLSKWIPILMQDMGVESFGLSIFAENYEVPSVVFESESLRNIALEGCAVSSWTSNLKNVQTIRLSYVNISEEILDNMLSNTCPFIESVTLSDCTGFTRIKCSNSNKQQQPTNLKQFIFTDYLRSLFISPDDPSNIHPDVSIEIGDDVQSLTTIDISHCLFSSVKHNQVFEFSHLTSLVMTSVKLIMSSDLFSCSLPCLEVLSLEECTGIKEFNLTSRRAIKRFHINNPNRPFKVTVDAPSVVSFRYEGILPQSISFPAATTSSNIILTSSREPSHSFNDLNGLLKALSQSEISLALDWFDIQLRIQGNRGVTNNNLPAVVEHLMINMPKRSSHSHWSAANFLKRLFRMFRPSFIRTEMKFSTIPSSELEGIIELLKERKVGRGYFWQSVLEEVSLQVLHRDPSVRRPFQYENHRTGWQPFRYTSFHELSSKCAAGKLEFRIHLKWKK